MSLLRLIADLPTCGCRLTDNGICCSARDTRRFVREADFVPCTTPVESPQSNGMAEAFVRTLKRDYVWVSPRPNARAVLD